MEKDLIEAKRYLSEQGYGNGTNYTTNLVAVLLSNYAQEQVNKLNKPDVIKSACKKEKCKHWNSLFNRCKFVNAECCKDVL